MKALVVIPDNTRNFHPKKILPVIKKVLAKTCERIDFIIALGLHRKLSPTELKELLGSSFLRKTRVLQHSQEDVVSCGSAGNVPVTLNRRLFSYDVIFTVGVVEPHLYAGFSGGIKCISIGLAGKKTILATHSTKSLTRPGVVLANVKNNPFQKFLWQAVKKIDAPIYSLNIVNRTPSPKTARITPSPHRGEGGSTGSPSLEPSRAQSREIFPALKGEGVVFYSLGAAKKSFDACVKFARKEFAYKIKERQDCVFVKCDKTKSSSLYQASRLFNYCLDKRPVVKKYGAIIVFADLGSKKKSRAEANFEACLSNVKLHKGCRFKKAGEHRAFKVIEAAKYANLAIVSKNAARYKTPRIKFFKDAASAKKWARSMYGPAMKSTLIPSGFSIIP